jgi:methionyl-tRNA synthetase
MSDPNAPYYITTPIYYVNDRPHIGHCYSTIVADCAARFMRLAGRDTFFLTGTDEHAEKVVTAAAERGLTPLEWADRNARSFREAFDLVESSHDDFVRTSETRHVEQVERFIATLKDSGDIYLGDYEGWYDPSQEEYVTETTAREHDYKSPVTGRELVKRSERNYFFRLSAYQDRLRKYIEDHPRFIMPEARRNEVLGRVKQGLSDVPVSRAVREGDPEWGIRMPGDEGHRVYVWIDALFNYLSVITAGGNERFWPANVHLLAKDILWFHAVIWPAMLMALDKPLPEMVYAHSYWIREGRKMSKSLGNFIDLETIQAYANDFGIDALRWYLVTHGPLSATDSDFVHDRFVEVYNADLANGIGNASSRVSNMIAKYFDGVLPDVEDIAAHAGRDWPELVRTRVEAVAEHMDRFEVAEALRQGVELSSEVDRYIHETEPFKLAKDPAKMDEVAGILSRCARALHAAAVILLPAMPAKMTELLQRFGTEAGAGEDFASLTRWDRCTGGTRIEKGAALFPRADPKNPAPDAG